MLPLSNVTIIGNVGMDPVFKVAGNMTAICEFSVAVSNKRNGEDITNWYRCAAFGRLADILQEQHTVGRFLKGSQAFVSGRLTVRDYVKKDGTPGYSLDVNVNECTFNEPRNAAASTDDVPF